MLRVVELVRGGGVRRGDVLHAQLEMRHPNRTGLALAGGGYVQQSEPFHLERMEATYGGERVCAFDMTPALSDDPFIGFALLADREAPLEVTLVNSRGERFRASHAIPIHGART